MKYSLVLLFVCLILPTALYSGDIWDAVTKNDTNQIKKLVEDIGIDVNITGENGRPLAYYITSLNNTNILDYFIKHGLNLFPDGKPDIVLSALLPYNMDYHMMDASDNLDYLLKLNNPDIDNVLTNYSGDPSLRQSPILDSLMGDLKYRYGSSQLYTFEDKRWDRTNGVNFLHVYSTTSNCDVKYYISRINSLLMIVNRYKTIKFNYIPFASDKSYFDYKNYANALIGNKQYFIGMIKQSKKLDDPTAAILIATKNNDILKLFTDLDYLDLSVSRYNAANCLTQIANYVNNSEALTLLKLQ
jgi:hypothetical protein